MKTSVLFFSLLVLLGVLFLNGLSGCPHGPGETEGEGEGEGEAVVLPAGNIIADVSSLQVPEGDVGIFRVKLGVAPESSVLVSIARINGSAGITVQSSASLTFTPANWNTYQSVTLAAAQDEDTDNGEATFRCSAPDWTSAYVMAFEQDYGDGPCGPGLFSGEEQTFLLPNSEGEGEGVSLTMVRIPAGCFWMGSADTELDRGGNEGPRHRVSIAQEFWIGKYEVTQAQWAAVMGTNPSYFQGIAADTPDTRLRPVEQVSWNDLQAFVDALNALPESPGGFRLPTEAEWEYACRAGAKTRFYWGDDENYTAIGGYAWYTANSDGQTRDVEGKTANPWGLYDLSGNVGEWVRDVYATGYTQTPVDGSAWDPAVEGEGEPERVLRGGNSNAGGAQCRSASRIFLPPDTRHRYVGFRLAR